MWLALRDKPYMAGQFLWSGIDYLGEARWPNTTAGSGLFTRILTQKQNGLQRESWWSDKPVVHVVRREDTSRQGAWVPSWTPVDTKNDSARLQVYSNCDEVELFINGRSLGSKQKPADDAPRNWTVAFEKGTLKAIGKNNGKVMATEELKTAGAPSRIDLSVDQTSLSNDWNDVAFVYATIEDANRVICSNATDRITFTVEGPGEVVVVDNGNLASHEMYKASAYDAYRGKVLAIIRSTGKPGNIVVKASANGISSGTVTITSK
jgi:beta-galactosidase